MRTAALIAAITLCTLSACRGADDDAPTGDDSTSVDSDTGRVTDTVPPGWLQADNAADAMLLNMVFPADLDVTYVQGPPPEATGSTMVITALPGAPDPMEVRPGDSFELAVDYAEVYTNPIDIIIHFDGGNGHLRIRYDIEEGRGTIRVPVQMREALCDDLANVLHDIRCNESLAGLSEVADFLTMNLALRCDVEATDTAPTGDTGVTVLTGDTGTTPTGTTGDSGITAIEPLPQATFEAEYPPLYCEMEQECNPYFSEYYYYGPKACLEYVEQRLVLQGGSCTYDGVAAAVCHQELEAAHVCNDWQGSWRDACDLVYSDCTY